MDEFIPVEEYPVPTDKSTIIKMQQDSLNDPYGLTDESNIVESVDEFHEKYVDELIRTDEWIFFRYVWNYESPYIYVWNHMGGYGFKFSSDWEVACSFIEAWDQFTDEFSSEDFEPSNYSWELP